VSLWLLAGSGGTWYGRVTAVGDGTYSVRIGGTDRVNEVPESQLRDHPTRRAIEVRRVYKTIVLLFRPEAKVPRCFRFDRADLIARHDDVKYAFKH
jgi:hypothetical protein